MLAQAGQARSGPTEDELRAYFEAHRAEFRQPARVRVSRVLLRGRADDKALKARAESIRLRAMKKEPLTKLVPLGEGPEVTQGGDIGWVAEAVDDETTAALVLKKPGDVTPVVAVASGVAVLVATARDEAREATYEEVRATVVGRYAPVLQRRVFDELVKQLKTDTQAQVNSAALP